MSDFKYEKKLWDKGLQIVVGMDEVGRGAFAGPVVASAVAFAPNSKLQISKIKVDDSKKLTAKQREEANRWIMENALAWGIGIAGVGHINKKGIISATNFAFRSSLKELKMKIEKQIDYLLIDAFYVPYIAGIPRDKQNPIVKGDSLSLSISAASIIAKVYRDKLMTNLGRNTNYSYYFWEKNKGYGTKEHRDAILKYGITKHHRKKFVSNLFFSPAL